MCHRIALKKIKGVLCVCVYKHTLQKEKSETWRMNQNVKEKIQAGGKMVPSKGLSLQV